MSKQFHIENDIDYDGNQLPAGEEFTELDYYKSMEIDFAKFILEVAAYFKQPLPRDHKNLKLFTQILLQKYAISQNTDEEFCSKEEAIRILEGEIIEKRKIVEESGCGGDIAELESMELALKDMLSS